MFFFPGGIFGASHHPWESKWAREQVEKSTLISPSTKRIYLKQRYCDLEDFIVTRENCVWNYLERTAQEDKFELITLQPSNEL